MVIDYKKYPSPRMRRHTSPNLYLQTNPSAFEPTYYPPAPQTLDWNDYFADGKPPEYLDIGCGRGSFLLERAVKNTSKNILGIEVRKQAVDWINSVISGEKMQNVAALWLTVVNGLPYISDNSIASVYYFFPDPWVKKKHNKRRAFTVDLLHELHRTLRSDGQIFIMTDVPEVEEYHAATVAEHGGFLIESAQSWDLPITNQERFCLSKKIPYTRAIITKKQSFRQ